MRVGKLFHAIVIVGASLTGACGDGDGNDAGPDDADAGEVVADAGAMDAGADAGDAPADAGEDAMVLIL